jgi:hypothetical protein
MEETYELTIKLTVITSMEPVRSADDRIIGFQIDDSNGSGTLKPNVAFEIVDNGNLEDGTDLSDPHLLYELGLDVDEFESFERSFQRDCHNHA